MGRPTGPPAAPGSPERRRRATIALGALGVAAAVYLVISFAGSLVTGLTVDGIAPGEPAASWEEAADRHDFALYRPTPPPVGAGTPTLRTVRLGPSAESFEAEYENGLVISQSASPPAEAAARATVRGAADARWEPADDGRLLAVRMGETWVRLWGVPEPELVRIAPALAPVARETR